MDSINIISVNNYKDAADICVNKNKDVADILRSNIQYPPPPSPTVISMYTSAVKSSDLDKCRSLPRNVQC